MIRLAGKLVNPDNINFVQELANGSKIYFNGGATESVIETLDQVQAAIRDVNMVIVEKKDADSSVSHYNVEKSIDEVNWCFVSASPEYADAFKDAFRLKSSRKEIHVRVVEMNHFNQPAKFYVV